MRLSLRNRRVRDSVMAALLLLCALVVAFWIVMGARSRRPWDAFEITEEDFAGFVPRPRAWTVTREPLPAGDIAPNIIAFRFWPHSRPHRGAGGGPVNARLVHGYNMHDCLRIKGYSVELINDSRERPASTGAQPERGAGQLEVREPFRGQIWRVVSDTGHVAVWITGMLRAGDFRETGIDTRSMPFPRVGAVNEPGWNIEGFQLKSLRHPIRNFRRFLRAKWNNARCDLLTFLRLRQPAWASEELLTLVSASQGVSVRSDDEADVIDHVLNVHCLMRDELQRWRTHELEGNSQTSAAD